MRVTNGTLVRHSVNNLNDSLERLDELNRRISTGKTISTPSDDPAGAATSLRLRSSLAEVQQYTRNVEDSISWLNATDSALGEATAVLQRARELAVQGANGTVPDDAREAIALEIDELIDHLVQVGNTFHDGRYLFGGQDTVTRPFQTTGSPAVTGVVYNGGTEPIVTEIGAGIRMEMDFSGDQVLVGSIETLIKLRDDLRAGNTAELSGTDLGALEDALDTVLYYRAEAGAKINRLERTLSRFQDLELNVNTLISENEDVDMAKAIMDLKTEENIYRAALSSSARIIQPSLLDFLK